MHVDTRSVCVGFTFGAKNMQSFIGLICLPAVELKTVGMFLKQNALFNVHLEIQPSTKNFHILSEDLPTQLKMIQIAKNSHIISAALRLEALKGLSNIDEHFTHNIGDHSLPKAHPVEWRDISIKLRKQCLIEIIENQSELFFVKALQNCLPDSNLGLSRNQQLLRKKIVEGTWLY